MNTFKRKALTTAVFAGLGIAGTAHAVYQDANGLGQALIYPYYTVQPGFDANNYNTYVSVVNTTATGKVVKVRFREGKNSREVLDFNLYLSPNDVWTGAVVSDGAGSTVGGRLLTSDKSCTNPAIPALGVAFRNFAYSGASDDGAGTGLDRSREGYIEMLEMATLPAGASLTAITHTAAGTPANCAAVQGPVVVHAPALTAPTGGLSGTGTLINVQNGADGGYEAIALANVTIAPIYTDIGNELGNLAQADPISVVVTSSATGTRVYNSVWTAGIDAVSSTMMHSNVINEFVMDTATKSNTDWVLTFPTKRFYVTTAAAAAPFTNKFTATGSCESIAFNYFNREERGAAAAGGDFSPLPPGSPASALCWESTVLSIRAGLSQNPTGTVSGVLGSVNTTSVNLIDPYQAGWANLSFTGANSLVGLISQAASFTINATTGGNAVGAQTYLGLPVVGMMARTFVNGTLTCTGGTCQGNYGSAFNHNYLDNIAPAP